MGRSMAVSEPASTASSTLIVSPPSISAEMPDCWFNAISPVLIISIID